MLPIEGRKSFANVEELLHALVLGLGGIFTLSPTRSPVALVGNNCLALDQLSIDLTDAVVRDDFRPVALVEGQQPGISARAFNMVGRPVRYGQADVHFELAVANARFITRGDALKRCFLVLVDGQNGRFHARVRQADLRALLLPHLQAAAANQGASIDSVEWTLRGDSSSKLTFDAHVQASKKVALLRASATLHGQGQLAIDEELNARLSDLVCQGDGVLGKMVAGALQGHLRQLESKPVPLAPFSLGRLRLRDLKIKADQELIVEAGLGS